MVYKGLRDWLAKLEEMGLLKRIKAEVDWNLEIGGIARLMSSQEGPALLFENIKGYQKTLFRRLCTNSLASRERVAMALGLPRETAYRDMITYIKDNIGRRLNSVVVASGPVKENIIKGDAINLYEFPVPMYHDLDGGRYINTHGTCTVTMDPDTKIMNVGIYRGMVGKDGKSIPVLLIHTQHWGIHFKKYAARGQEMPVALAYGCDPVLTMCAGTPIGHSGCSEYEVAGGLSGAPVEIVKCELSDLYVPAHAEIVIEGWISPDPKTFQMEGPFGEYPGYYGGVARPKPAIRVKCITYRKDPILQGGIAGHRAHQLGESNYFRMAFSPAFIWKHLEDAGVPGVTGVWGSPASNLQNLRIQIDKLYRGHAKQVAAGFWGQGDIHDGKNLIVVDKDIDIFDDEAVEWAFAYRTNAAMHDIQFFLGTPGSTLDASSPLSERSAEKYGAGKWARVFIDATVNWDLEPEEQYGGKREPPSCTDLTPETAELVRRRWKEYGF
jgi:UbiD family decarboxylase